MEQYGSDVMHLTIGHRMLTAIGPTSSVAFSLHLFFSLCLHAGVVGTDASLIGSIFPIIIDNLEMFYPMNFLICTHMGVE